MNNEIIRLNRIKMERQLLKEDFMYFWENGVSFCYDDDNINDIYILFIIKYDNIYKHSQHIFKFTYTENYPFDPPKLKYLTSKKKARLHPNFYANGKCCLSLLGTWSGPQWTSCNNITSIVNSIIPLFTDDPLQFEPTFEDKEKHKHLYKSYNIYVQYQCYLLLLDNLINPIVKNKLYFIMKNYYMDNYNEIMNTFKELKNNNNKKIDISVYHDSCIIDYENTKTNLDNLCNKFNLSNE